MKFENKYCKATKQNLKKAKELGYDIWIGNRELKLSSNDIYVFIPSTKELDICRYGNVDAIKSISKYKEVHLVENEFKIKINKNLEPIKITSEYLLSKMNQIFGKRHAHKDYHNILILKELE